MDKSPGVGGGGAQSTPVQLYLVIKQLMLGQKLHRILQNLTRNEENINLAYRKPVEDPNLKSIV